LELVVLGAAADAKRLEQAFARLDWRQNPGVG
jgi:hypothetical protein